MSHITRPEGTSLAAKSRTLRGDEAVRPTDIVPHQEPPRPAKKAQAPGNDSGVSEKEELLEQKLAAEALAGFEHMSRHQLNFDRVTRVAVDPDRMRLYHDAIAELIDGSDLGELDLADDEPLPEFEFCVQASSSDGVPQLPSDASGLQVGFGCPAAVGRSAGPDQDRLFAARAAGFTLVGVVNSHGSQAVGAELAKLVAEEMPKAVFGHPALTQGGQDPSMALSFAFQHMHCLAAAALDLSLTGASLTAVLIDDECIFVAHVGDCRAVLGVPDPQANAEAFHFVPMALSEDHKISVKPEFDRIQECGGEMRKLVNDTVYRLFLKDEDIPGLTLTRAIGDRAAHTVGVTHTPSLMAVRRADIAEGSFLILGSGGVWATMSERVAVNWVSKHFATVGEGASSLAQESHIRWQDPGCKAKASLRADVPDCFGVALIALDAPAQAAEALKLRPFGLHNQVKRDWKEVKSQDWSKAYRGQGSGVIHAAS